MDLHSGAPYWLLAGGLGLVVPPLARDLDCDVAIIGCGLTGALVAHEMLRHGLNVVALDRRDIGLGSTVANTALLLYDTDVPLHILAQRTSVAAAERVFHAGIEAIDRLGELCGELACPFERRSSLYLGRDEDRTPELAREFEARRRAGLEVEWIDRASLRRGWGIDAPAAIRSAAGAQTDPYQLCGAVWSRCVCAGARVHDRTRVAEVAERADRLVLCTDRGPTVRARFVVHASGYETVGLLPQGIVELASTFAFASEPLAPARGTWQDRCTLWEYADPYLYARWVGDRLLVGGEDEPFADEQARDRLLPAKTRALVARAMGLVPGLALEPAFAWTGTFATTADGIGLIGPLPDDPRRLLALAFGGNGTTLAAVAARLLSERVLGRTSADAELFAPTRRSLRTDETRFMTQSLHAHVSAPS